MRLSDAWIRRAVMLAIALLVVHALGDWLHSAFGTVVAVASALLVGAVLLFISRAASLVVLALIGAWLLLARWWSLMPHPESDWARVAEFAPFVIGFAAPVRSSWRRMGSSGCARIRDLQAPATQSVLPGELRAEEKDLRRVVHPGEQRNHRSRSPKARGHRAVSQIEANGMLAQRE